MEFSEGLMAMLQQQRRAITAQISVAVLVAARGSQAELEAAAARGGWLDIWIDNATDVCCFVEDRVVVARATFAPLTPLPVAAPRLDDGEWRRLAELTDDAASNVRVVLTGDFAVLDGERVCLPSEISKDDVMVLLRKAAVLAMRAAGAGQPWGEGWAADILKVCRKD